MAADRLSALERARTAWGETIPDWIIALAAECDRASQAKVAARLDVSGALISQVIAAKYPSPTDRIEMAVRGAFMAQVVDCPVLGILSTEICAQHQRQGFSTANPQSVRLSRACPNCLSRNGDSHG